MSYSSPKWRADFFVIGIVAALAAASCTTIQYDGDNRAPTTKVDVYNSEKEVKRPYDVLGQIKASAQANRIRAVRMRDRVLEEAKKRGADAVIFLSTETGIVENRDYFEEYRMRDRPNDFGPEYDRVRIIKAQLIAYK